MKLFFDVIGMLFLWTFLNLLGILFTIFFIGYSYELFKFINEKLF